MLAMCNSEMFVWKIGFVKSKVMNWLNFKMSAHTHREETKRKLCTNIIHMTFTCAFGALKHQIDYNQFTALNLNGPHKIRFLKIWVFQLEIKLIRFVVAAAFFGSRNEIMNSGAEEKLKMKAWGERVKENIVLGTVMHSLDENANKLILECLLNIQLSAN